MLQPGILVTEKVRLVSPIGRGGMGEVWLADHLMLSTQVAVKFLDPELAEDDPAMLERFKAEAKIAAGLRSPHVVQIFDFGIYEGARPYIVMELLAGESLGDRLHRVGPMSPREVGMVLRQAAEAFGAAHQAGIVHRDIKPDNLFIIESGYELFIKVLDFGIAKQSALINPKVMTGAWDVVGTPAYMSPEQLVSTKNVDARTDLWALTIVAYELLTGDVPYMADTVTGFYDAILREPPPSLSHKVPGAPPTLDAWVSRALQRNPAHRYQTAQELADGFLAATSQVAPRAAEALPPSQPTSGSGVLRRPDTVSGVASSAQVAGKRPLGWIAAAMVLFGLIGVGGWWLMTRQVDRAAAAASAIQSVPQPSASVEARAEPTPAVPAPATFTPSPPEATASAKTVASVAPAPRRPVSRPPQPEPPPPSDPQPVPKPARCSGADGFILDRNGNLKPRPECL